LLWGGNYGFIEIEMATSRARQDVSKERFARSWWNVGWNYGDGRAVGDGGGMRGGLHVKRWPVRLHLLSNFVYIEVLASIRSSFAAARQSVVRGLTGLLCHAVILFFLLFLLSSDRFLC